MRRIAVATIGVLLLAVRIGGQQNTTTSPRLTAEDYARAERMMSSNTAPLVYRASVRAHWLPDDRFWYRNTIPGGAEFMLVDPRRGTRERAFEHDAIAAALSKASGNAYTATTLPFSEFTFSPGERAIEFTLADRRWSCDTQGSACQVSGDAPRRRAEVLSPDRTRAAFIRDYNLWIRDVATGTETQLTIDGAKDFGYATDDAGWERSDTPVVVWSPDAKKIATFQHDSRGVGEMYYVPTVVGHPRLTITKYPLPGDEKIFMIQRVVIDIGRRAVTRFKMPPDPHRSSLCDHVVCDGMWADVQWSPDSTEIAFVSTSRDHKREDFRVADAATGSVRNVFAEEVATFFESGLGRVNWKYLPASREVLWYSRKDNWGHLYLHDAGSGLEKSRITSGDGNVTEVLRVDEKMRTIYFVGVGKEAGRDPYFRHFYKINFDGKGAALLTSENADHTIDLSPSGRYFVDSYSKPDAAPVIVLRDVDGRLVMPLEKADISKLEAAGWKPPMPITVKARDGKTDLYGLLYRPANFDPAQRYPIINRIYPGPQTGSVGTRSFVASRGDAQAIATLGFVVVQIDGMGTPWRSREFHEAYFGNMGDNTLPDQVAGMKELAARFPWIDIDRAGIYGHSGGGYAAAAAMFRYPDFFKVGVAQAGNHDNRAYEDDWAEKWMGLVTKNPDGTTNYDDQANQNHAKNLKGKLLLAHGTMDTNVPPYNTLLVVDALIRANKDFDLILFPNRAHGFGNEPYMVRRRWDYFVRYLMGAEPPAAYEMQSSSQSPRMGPSGPYNPNDIKLARPFGDTARQEVARRIQGSIDIHMHTDPDVAPRPVDAIDVVKLAQAHGLRAIVLKNHYESTAAQAYLMRKIVPGIEVFGAITLDLANGGINPAAVDHFANMKGGFGRIVWFPTYDAEAAVRASKQDRPFARVSRDGALVAESKEVIAIIAKHGLALATGHVSPEEGLLLIREARAQGVQRLVVTHAMDSRWSVPQMQEAARLGALIEFAKPVARISVAEYAQAIKKIGADACLISETGVSFLPEELVGAFVVALREQGITDGELDRMMKINPAKLLGLPLQ